MTSFLEPEFEPPVEKDGFCSRRARLGREAGCEHLGLSLFELEPGSAAFPLHYHFGNEELLIALSGELALRTTEGERPLAEGEVVALPVGEAGAHQVINRGDGPARLLMASEMKAPDIVVRLDSQKVSAAGFPPGLLADGYHEIFHRRDATDFWDGEPPAPARGLVNGTVGVAGAGTMGAGIAQLAALAGYDTLLHDPQPEALERGIERLRADLERGAERDRWSAAEAEAAAARVRPAPSIEGLGGAGFVVEAAPEDVALKRVLFAALEEACADDAVLATNTSSLSVGAIAAEAARPERICGMHFFNPPALMKLVEVVAGEATAEPALAATTEVAEQMGRVPVRCTDSPGFIVNRCNRPFALESLRMVGDGVAEPAQIDRIVREDGGYRMGPFELMDLIGIDVNLNVARSFFEQRPEPRWEPHPIQERMVAEGRLGRKTGAGFYEYADGKRVEAPEAEVGDDLRRTVLDRLLAQLINEGCFAAGEGVAAPDDIDAAMRLGLNHPRGPFEWLDELGSERVLVTLDALGDELGADRYRAAPFLLDRAAAQ